MSIRSISGVFDTINITQILRDGETIVSSGQTFELGFFSPGNSKNRYVGIWYKKITVRTVVWVANREVPLTTATGVLKLVKPGLLVLLNDTNGITIWSTNATRPVNNPVTKLLDSGNLVVKDSNGDDPENFVWESFNHQMFTMLPGMKFGWNFRTGLEVYATTWKSDDDPSSGDYTYHFDPTGYPQKVLKKGSIVLYKTGPWNGLRYSGLPNLSVSNYLSQVLRSIHVGLLCVQKSPEDRPNMSSVVLMFGNEGQLPRARQPGWMLSQLRIVSLQWI